jgi:hypothetical protein
MLFFTFFSKTIHYSIHPKVTAEAITGGYLEKTYDLEATVSRDERGIIFIFTTSHAIADEMLTASMVQITVERSSIRLRLDNVTHGEAASELFFRPSNTIVNQLIVQASYEDKVYRTQTVVRSQIYDAIIPRSAVINGMFVYVLSSKAGYFGEHYSVNLLFVKIIDTDGRNYAIELDIFGGTVVTGWDSALFDGAEVILLR